MPSKKLLTLLIAILTLVSCSTTSGLPEGETLYTGIKAVNIEGKTGSDAEETALEEMNGALAYTPNNSLFGSSYTRSPLPLGLWIYNSMVDKEKKGLSKWFFNTFAATPKTISSASPDTRAMVARNILQNYGYFQADVDYNLITNQKNPKKQKIEYNVNLGRAYTFDSIKYNFPSVQDSIIQATTDNSYLHQDAQFSVANLQSEKNRLNTAFHNNGFYYYRPDYIKYFADSVNIPGKVKLLVVPELDIPLKAQKQWKFGRVSAYIRKHQTSGGRRMQGYNDTINYKRLTLAYQGNKIPVKPRVMFRNFKFWTGRQYSEEKVQNTIRELSGMNVFSGVQFSFTPHDTTDTCSVLDVRLDATMDKLIDASLEFDFTQKSNSQLGPNMAIAFSKRNAFHHAEVLTLKLKGSYYWQTRNRSSEEYNNMDTYEYGIEGSIAYPYLVFPGFLNRRYKYPTSSNFNVAFTRTNVAKAYRFNRYSFGAEYNFQTSRYISHTFTPLRVEVMDVRDTQLLYEDSLSTTQSRALVSLWATSGFTPSLQYSFRYNNSTNTRLRNTTNFELTFKEAGNIISGIQGIFGMNVHEKEKKFLFAPYYQFVKGTMELRNKFRLTTNSCIATRLFLGAIYAYGNSNGTPLSDWFYSGGANSVRAFSARTIGPGATRYVKGDMYLVHSGDVKFEANAEYRFPMFGNLNGAVFLDAGNVWEWRSLTDEQVEILENNGLDPDSFDSEFKFKTFPKQLALGTGFGFRYDLDFLVLRLDVGIAIHAPYNTGKSGYYNIRKFYKDGVAFHFAVGYPF